MAHSEGELAILDLAGLAAGDYKVVAQAVQAGFTLAVDEVALHQIYMPLVSH